MSNANKRVKTVYRNASEVCHIWAQQSGVDVRCSNAHSDGTALYSYATPIANFVTNAKGKPAVLITTERYSVTTSQNMPTASDIPGGYAIGSWYSDEARDAGKTVPVFHVRHICHTGGRAPWPSAQGPHWDNVETMQGEYLELLKKLSRAKANAENYTRDLNLLRAKAQAYCKFFGVPFVGKKFPPVSEETIARAKAVTLAETKRKSEANKARRERDAINAETVCAEYLSNVRAFLPYNWQNASNETIAKVREYQREQWLNGTITRLEQNSGFETLLRVRGEDIETSRGATFPLAHGLKALPYIRAIVASGEVWQRNGKTIHLGHYQIDRIEGGQIVAGCHKLPVSEVERLAASLGV